MQWADVQNDPLLQKLPFKTELSRRRRIGKQGDMHTKAGLYREAGATEAGVVTLDGKKTVIHPPS